MIKVLTVLFVLCQTILGWSQSSSVIEGKAFARSKTEAFNGFVGEDDLGLYAVDYIYTSKKRKELIVRKFYKSDMSLVEEKDIFQNPLPDYYNKPYEVLLVNSKLYLFTIFTHIKEGTTTMGLFIYLSLIHI